MSQLEFDIDFRSDPLPGPRLHELLAQARTSSGLAKARLFGLPAFILVRFAHLREFFMDHKRFPGGATYQFEIKPVVGNTFINMDGEEHNRYRQLAMPAFRSRAVNRFVETDLTPLAHEIVSRFVNRGEGDLVTDFADVMPFWAISRKLGLPVGSEEQQRLWAHAMLSHPADPDGALAAAREVTRFLKPALDERRRHPRDDVLSDLLAAEQAGMRFTEEEIYSHVRLLYAVGATTTSDAMSSLFWRLLTEPGLADRARREPAIRRGIVNEALRCEPPVAVLPRIVPDGGELAGVELPPGAIVMAAIAGANRDPDVFPEPDRYNPDRPESEIMSFGFGSKFCPGAYLAQGQLQTALEVVLERLPGLRLVEATEPAGAILRSVEHLKVAWEPPSGAR